MSTKSVGVYVYMSTGKLLCVYGSHVLSIFCGTTGQSPEQISLWGHKCISYLILYLIL